MTTRSPLRATAAAVVGCAALALTACGSDSDSGSASGSGSADEIVIGVGLPSTGGSALLGEPMGNGIQMAVDAANEAGGINGAQIRLVTEDTGGDDASALNAFNRLTSEDPAAVIGYPVSTQAFAIMTQVDRAGIPVIAGGSNSKLAAGSDWMFDMTATDEVTSTAAVEFAVEQLGVSKIALLRESGELGTGASEVVTEAAEAAGAEIVDEEIFQTGDVDLSAQANNLRDSDADMLFVYGQQPDYIVASNALATAGVSLPAFMAGVQPATLEKIDFGSLEAIYNRNQCVPAASEEPDTKAFVTDYQAAFGAVPPEYAAIAYDGMNLLIDALTSAGTDPDDLSEALASLPESEGVCGVHRGGEDGNLSFGVTLGHYGADRVYTVDEVSSVDAG